MNVKFNLSAINNKICEDTGGENESHKLIVVVRQITLTMLVYTLISCIHTISIQHLEEMGFCLVSFLLFLFIFITSYRFKTFVSYCVLNICILGWIITNVIVYGWNNGVQHFLLTLLVFCFFSKYQYEAAKVAYSIFLFTMRIALYFYCQNNAPLIALDLSNNVIIQIVNSLTVFVSLALIAYTFSTDTQALEGKLIEYNERLQKQANTDTLTGLFNRRKTIEYLDSLLKSADNQISFCLCDIDFFKKVNDTYGHNIGDEVLKTLSDTFRKELPKDTFISRWGGEEFLLIFPGLNGDETMVALEKLRQKVKSIVFDGGIEKFSISLTFGLVEYDYHSDLTTLLKQADEKLYIGKENGRDRIIF